LKFKIKSLTSSNVTEDDNRSSVEHPKEDEEPVDFLIDTVNNGLNLFSI
jgi:hypothetical protein